jgi:hypothetical protein
MHHRLSRIVGIEWSVRIFGFLRVRRSSIAAIYGCKYYRRITYGIIEAT